MSILKVITLAFITALGASAQINAFIYQIKIYGCSMPPTNRTQTGFRVKGQAGIVTALHGIVGCKLVKAKAEDNAPMLYDPLVLSSVDVTGDAALLTSAELDGQGDAGLLIAEGVKLSDPGELTVYGHPHGINLTPSRVRARQPALVELNDRLPPGDQEAYLIRHSPDPHRRILDVEGVLLPGDSGAPILNASNQVVAVADGGLDHGFAQISWGIPYRSISWRAVATKQRELNTLASSNSPQLFAFDADEGGTTEKVGPSAQAENSEDIAPNSQIEVARLGPFGSTLSYSTLWLKIQESGTRVDLTYRDLKAEFILEDAGNTVDDLKSMFIKRLGTRPSPIIEEDAVKKISGNQFQALKVRHLGFEYLAYFYSDSAGALQAVVYGPETSVASLGAEISQLFAGISLKGRFDSDR